jgi:uncharacterized protein
MNTVNRFKWTGLKLFHLTAGGTTETSQMIMADRKYAYRDTGPFPIRVVWAQAKSCSGYIVRGDSPIKTIYDVKPGVRFSDMLPFAASVRIVEAFLAWAKVANKDVVWIPGKNYRENVQAVVDGKADISFGIPTSPAILEAEKNPKGIRWIEMNPNADPEGAKRLWEVDPLVTFGRMFGVPSCEGIWSNVGTSLYTTHADTPPMMVHRLARWFDENFPRYKDLHSWNKYMTKETLLEELETTFIPCHEGLVRYLKELEIWTDAHEKRQKYNVELIERYIKAYTEAKDLADEKSMAISPDNKDWLSFWENYRKDKGLPDVKLFKSLAEAA